MQWHGVGSRYDWCDNWEECNWRRLDDIFRHAFGVVALKSGVGGREKGPEGSYPYPESHGAVEQAPPWREGLVVSYRRLLHRDTHTQLEHFYSLPPDTQKKVYYSEFSSEEMEDSRN